MNKSTYTLNKSNKRSKQIEGYLLLEAEGQVEVVSLGPDDQGLLLLLERVVSVVEGAAWSVEGGGCRVRCIVQREWRQWWRVQDEVWSVESAGSSEGYFRG